MFTKQEGTNPRNFNANAGGVSSMGTGGQQPQVKLTAQETTLLYMLDTLGPLSVTDALFEDSETDINAFAVAATNLLDKRLISLNADLTYGLTSSGRQCLSKGIAVVYPLTPKGTASDYLKTLITMSPAAHNALAESMLRVPTFIQNVMPARFGRLLESLINAGITRRFPLHVSKLAFTTFLEHTFFGVTKSEGLLAGSNYALSTISQSFESAVGNTTEFVNNLLAGSNSLRVERTHVPNIGDIVSVNADGVTLVHLDGSEEEVTYTDMTPSMLMSVNEFLDTQ